MMGHLGHRFLAPSSVVLSHPASGTSFMAAGLQGQLWIGARPLVSPPLLWLSRVLLLWLRLVLLLQWLWFLCQGRSGLRTQAFCLMGGAAPGDTGSSRNRAEVYTWSRHRLEGSAGLD